MTAQWGRQGIVNCIIAPWNTCSRYLVPGWCWLTVEMWTDLYHLEKANHLETEIVHIIHSHKSNDFFFFLIVSDCIDLIHRAYFCPRLQTSPGEMMEPVIWIALYWLGIKSLLIPF